MRVLILGGSGMLGHKLWQHFQGRFDTWVTVRANYGTYARYGIFISERLLGNVDAFDFESVMRAISIVRPDVVVNCIGIIKQLSSAKDPIISISINSLFPHRLALLCQMANIRLIHFSTDCVFSGRKGMYTQDSISDAEDLYGRTKYLGEVGGSTAITIRSSIIGRELNSTSGLIEWFLSNQGKTVKGFKEAIYSGFTTQVMARLVADIIENFPGLEGIYQVSSEPISKFDLLNLVNDAFGVNVNILPDNSLKIDRSLDGSHFRSITGFTPPSWGEMISEMAADPTPYAEWRSSCES